MARSTLLDRGRERAVIYPEVYEVNRRGERYKGPASEGVPVRVTVSAEKQALAELPGQVDVKAVSLVFRWDSRKGQLGDNARVVFRDEEWDLSMPPHFSPGPTRAVEHVELVIKSRNRLGGETFG